MKYIDAEKLKETINKRLQENANKACLFGAAFAGRAAEDNDIINLIDSLPEEQPSEDLEEAARYVYESWMGGTMDDVRRDMVELGKALNARKED